MPLHRRNSTGQSEGDYLEEIVETAEVEDDHLLEITCSAPKVLSSACYLQLRRAGYCRISCVCVELRERVYWTCLGVSN